MMNELDDFLGLEEVGVLDPIWEILSQSIWERSCVLFLGPNLLRTEPKGKLSPPLRNAFIHRLRLQLDQRGEGLYDQGAKNHLPYIAQRYLLHNKALTEEDLSRNYAGFISKYHKDRPHYYDLLAQLPFDFIINTAEDDFLYEAFLAQGKEPHTAYFNYRDNQSSFQVKPHPKTPLIYNLFGHYRRTTSSLVLTQKQQIDFILSVVGRDAAIPVDIKKEVKTRSKLFFIGFSEPDWQMPLLFTSLGLRDKSEAENEQVLYLEHLRSKNGNIARRHLYEDVYRFEFRNQEDSDFIQTLFAAYQAWQEQHDQSAGLSRIGGYPAHLQFNQAGKARILFLSANPHDLQRLDINEEIKTIDEQRRLSDAKHKVELKPALDVGREDLQSLLLDNKPEVLHFSGHGQNNELVFYNARGQSETASTDAIAQLFAEFSDHLCCVVLNACATAQQAAAIARYIPNVIATNDLIYDKGALTFSRSFYQALFAGMSYEKAWRLALNSLDLEALPDEGKFVFFKDGERQIWEPPKTEQHD